MLFAALLIAGIGLLVVAMTPPIDTFLRRHLGHGSRTSGSASIDPAGQDRFATREPPTLRDFLYIDVDRVRSLLAQLEGGVIESAVERLTRGSEARAGASLFGVVDAGGTLSNEQTAERTKSLHDALYLLLETAADGVDLFATSVDLSDRTSWQNGGVHDSLSEGQLVRVTAPVRILDSTHFRKRIEDFARWPRLIASVSNQDELARHKNPKERERRLQQLMEASGFGSAAELDFLHDIAEFVELFMASQISVRQFPVGLEDQEFALVGTLLDRSQYLQEERAAIFAKYGSQASAWTMVSQISAIPDPNTASSMPNFASLVNENEEISRGELEQLAIELLNMLEQVGVAEAPRYPSVSITPIAVFRSFTP